MIQDTAVCKDDDGYEALLWSQSHVSEDFDIVDALLHLPAQLSHRGALCAALSGKPGLDDVHVVRR